MDAAGLSKQKLIAVAMEEDASLDDRYEAARELQARSVRGDMVADLVRMWPTHTETEIARYLGVPQQEVRDEANKLGLPMGRCS